MKRIKPYMLSMAMLLTFSFPSYADGNDLLDNCLAAEKFMDTQEMNNPFGIGVCFGMVQGVRNTMSILGKNKVVEACLPKNGITNGQATRIVVSYLKRNPAILHYDEVLLTMAAFGEAYPCK
ncbi:Rap1a/Tai family immunity protein [Vibrio sp. Vb2110]|uniref:Rap1a/Tai family immunity protein n=1 Tax=Vibrio TaxID=662 RepID=UPI001BD3FF2B|nr:MULTISPECIES: Rap1a/Tai family immunity protein [Vibrio]MBS9988273.1 hypothetical protein [Vibrio alginolyticus]MDW1846166.1 Rap1a/Tai family immunity protein [Vibrio sp. Vb2130]MDW1880438.1 Rap1a/Tai family immunity protein [Vibrio sp. Vb2110]MDW2036471.1 Rap1a/Tai family immunity protein [Vibrio sp. 2130-1]MDW2133699.1 Rap1a/Tai family immunity protein [Vibrio sp. 2128(2023)]